MRSRSEAGGYGKDVGEGDASALRRGIRQLFQGMKVPFFAVGTAPTSGVSVRTASCVPSRPGADVGVTAGPVSETDETPAGASVPGVGIASLGGQISSTRSGCSM